MQNKLKIFGGLYWFKCKTPDGIEIVGVHANSHDLAVELISGCNPDQTYPCFEIIAEVTEHWNMVS